MSNPKIQEAHQALQQLAEDPRARALAQWREDELRLQRMELTMAEKKGLEKGLEKGLREAVRSLCEVLDIKWTEEKQARVAGANAIDLEALRGHLARHRRWPGETPE